MIAVLVIATNSFYAVRPVHAPQRTLAKVSTASEPAPFGDGAFDVPAAEIQNIFQTDILRRCNELILLGWLGRAYLAAPVVFDCIWPSLFSLSTYNVSAAACYEQQTGHMDVVLRESSVGGPKGIPMRLALEVTGGTPADERIVSATLLGIGCDLTREATLSPAKTRAELMSDVRVERLCVTLNSDAPSKRVVVSALTRGIFTKLAPVAKAARREVSLEVSADPTSFTPRHEVWGLEGSSYKWLQQGV